MSEPVVALTHMFVVSRSHPSHLSLASGPPRVSELGVRLTRVGFGELDVESEGVLGHLLGQDAGLGAQGADVAVDGGVQVDSDTRGSNGSRGKVSVGLRSAGGGLRRVLGGADAGLGCKNVGVGQRQSQSGLALGSAAQGGEFSLAKALFVGVDAVNHLEVGAWGWVGVDCESLDGRGEFGESLLHTGVEAVELRAEDVILPRYAVVLHASFELLEDGKDVAVTEERGGSGGAGGSIALQKGGDDLWGAASVCEVSLGLRFSEGDLAKAGLARHAGEFELRFDLVEEPALRLTVAGDGGEGGWRYGLAHRVAARTISHLDRRRASGVSNGAGRRVCAREEGGDLHLVRRLLDTAGSAGREAEGVPSSRHVQEFHLLTLRSWGLEVVG